MLTLSLSLSLSLSIFLSLSLPLPRHLSLLLCVCADSQELVLGESEAGAGTGKSHLLIFSLGCLPAFFLYYLFVSRHRLPSDNRRYSSSLRKRMWDKKTRKVMNKRFLCMTVLIKDGPDDCTILTSPLVGENPVLP